MKQPCKHGGAKPSEKMEVCGGCIIPVQFCLMRACSLDLGCKQLLSVKRGMQVEFAFSQLLALLEETLQTQGCF